METYKLLHLSDLHISVPTWRQRVRNLFFCSHDSNALMALAEFIWVWRDKLDAILISGDIVDIDGIQDDLMTAYGFFKQPPAAPQLGKLPWITDDNTPTISFFEKPVILMPGNHDRFHNELGRPGCTLFDKHFADYWPVAHGGVWRYTLRKNGSSLGVVVGDFSLFSIGNSSIAAGHFGQGMVDHRINAMKAETERIKEDGAQAVIWMIHFVPEIDNDDAKFNNGRIGSYKLKRMNLIGCDKLSSAAKAVGVNHVLCGHTHIKSQYRTIANNDLSVFCAGTSTCTAGIGKEDTMIHLRKIEINSRGISSFESLDIKYSNKPSPAFIL